MEGLHSWLSSARKAVQQPLRDMFVKGLHALPPLARLYSTDPRDIGVEGDPPLCRACVRIFSKDKDLGHPRSLSTRLERLKISAELGCYVCSLLYNAVWTPSGGSSTDALAPQRLRDMVSENIGMAYWIDVANADEQPGYFEIMFTNVEMDKLDTIWYMRLILVPEEAIDETMSRQISNLNSIDTALNLASQWIEHCEANHPRCHVVSSPNVWRPTRLVYVGNHNDPLTPRICLSKDVPVGAHYVTLSHCWGHRDIYKLLKANLDVFMKAIPFENLTSLFRHAIEFTRRLNVEYIWIDSLCIIQDSYDDWVRESAIMGKIYKYSWCNISATGFADGSSSLYVQRNPATMQPRKFSINIQDPDNKAGSYSHSGNYYCMEDFWEADITKGPANSRAWVLQERLLAPRVLHFGSRQIMWECKELEACEIFPAGTPTQIKSGFKTAGLLDDLIIDNATRQEQEAYKVNDVKTERGLSVNEVVAAAEDGHNIEEDVLDDVKGDKSFGSENDNSESLDNLDETYYSLLGRWRSLTSAYNDKDLTRYQDKFVAISGLATEMQLLIKEDYIAGFWKRNFLQQLAWHAKYEGKDFGRIHRPQPYQAPSWSWACLNSPLDDLAVMSADPLAFIVDYGITLADENPFGQITDGFLRIRGRLSKAAFVDSDKVLRKRWADHFQVLRLRNIHPNIHVEINPYIFPDTYTAAPTGKRGFPSYPIHVSLGSREFWILPICRNPGGCPGLVLKHTGIKGQYQRIGAFVQPDSYEVEFQALMDHTPLLNEDEYEASDGDGNVTITII